MVGAAVKCYIVRVTLYDTWFKSIDGIENRYAVDVEFNEEFRRLGAVLCRPLFKKISPL